MNDSVIDDGRLNARQLRKGEEEDIGKKLDKIERNDIYIILESVYDTYNIGGLFRLADALAVKGLYLCGDMETPPNARIMKASIGTYKVVPWMYRENAQVAIAELREKHPEGIDIVAVEQDARAEPLESVSFRKPMALILGNETFGVTPETLALADRIVEIPMWGVNKSLNVIVSAAIVAYRAMLSPLTKPTR
jgi:tRNA G18 (ribose-2'-O)-methylase SpoU